MKGNGGRENGGKRRRRDEGSGREGREEEGGTLDPHSVGNRLTPLRPNRLNSTEEKDLSRDPIFFFLPCDVNTSIA